MHNKFSGTHIPEKVTYNKTVELAEKVKDSFAERELKRPKFIFVARTGLEVAGTFARHLGIGGSKILVACVERDRSRDEPKFLVGQFPGKKHVKGENIVAVDVVCRTGTTLKYTTERLRDLGANLVESAVIFDMSNLNGVNNVYSPDHSAEKGKFTGYAIFHWETEEELATEEYLRAKQRAAEQQALGENL